MTRQTSRTIDLTNADVTAVKKLKAQIARKREARMTVKYYVTGTPTDRETRTTSSGLHIGIE